MGRMVVDARGSQNNSSFSTTQGYIRMAEEPLHSVAKGCLVAAISSTD